MSPFFATVSSSSAEIWVISFAAAGGIIVFLGLFLERIAEWKSEEHIVKPRKCVSDWGWRILMIGIAFEIGVAIWSAYDAWEGDPLNQPITSVGAVVWFSTEGGTSRTAVDNLNKLMNPRTIHLAFGPREEVVKPGWPTLFCSDWLNYFDGTNTHWGFQFNQNLLIDPVQNEIVRDADNWNTFFIEVRFLPPKTKIVGGQITLFVNATIKKFNIPPQTLKSYNADFTDFQHNPTNSVTVFGE